MPVVRDLAHGIIGSMEVVFIVVVVGLTIAAGVTSVVVYAIVRGPRKPSSKERARNQASAEEWVARTKGADHVARMRGE